jgi:hypothetical protein
VERSGGEFDILHLPELVGVKRLTMIAQLTLLAQIVDQEFWSFGNNTARRFYEVTKKRMHPTDILEKLTGVMVDY